MTTSSLPCILHMPYSMTSLFKHLPSYVHVTSHMILHNLFFFLNQQFITRLAEEDRVSYFRNYVQRKQTNMKFKKRKKEKEKKRRKEKNRMK